MTKRTAAPDTSSEATSVPREGTVHRGPGPRLRRAGRTAAILAVLAFIALLTFLTSRYSHDFAPAAEEDPAAASPLASMPLSAERIEELARRRIEEEIRAAQQPPPPPELDFGLLEAAPEDSSYLPPPPPPPPVSRRPPSGPARADRPALHSPLTPRRSGAAPSSEAPPLQVPEVPSLPHSLGFPEARGSSEGADRLTVPHDSPGDRRLHSAAPPPLDRRALDLPAASAYALTRSPPPVQPTLYAGTAVPLVLTHDVATDVPGPVRAYVARDVFDSLAGARLLIPRGSLVIGHQAAHAAAGDQRILIHWRELKLRSGASFPLPVLPGGSLDGTAGVRGDVDNHWWSRVGSAVALSLVGAGVQLSQPQERTAVQGLAPSEGQVAARQLALELGRLSQEILRRGVNRPPTIQLRAGQRLTLLLTRDLAFPG